jgi:hypothetical protein
MWVINRPVLHLAGPGGTGRKEDGATSRCVTFVIHDPRNPR